MARKNGFTTLLRAGTQIARAIDKENRRQERAAVQRQRAEEREQRQLHREWEARQREQKRLAKQQEKNAMQAFLQAGQNALALRCRERAEAREVLLRDIYQ